MKKVCLGFLPLIFLVCFSLSAETAEGVFPEELGDAATPVWRMALGGAVTGVPTVQGGTLVVVLDGGHIRAYTSDGKALWDYYAGGKLAPYVSRSREGTCYVYRTDGTLIAVNRAGRELWRIKPEAPAAGGVPPELSAPIVSGWDGRIFVTLGRRLYCYTAAGYRLWRLELEHTPVLGPVPDKSGGLVMALENGDLAGLSRSGSVSTRPLDEIPSVLAPLEDGVLVLFKNGGMKFFAGRSGRRNVTENLPNLGGTPIGGIALGNHAAAVLSGGKVVLVSLNDGKVLWTGESHIRSGDASPGVETLYDERGIYVITREGASGFTPDGRRLWTLRIRGAASVPAFSGGGMLYSGGSDWILYAYRLEERVLRERNSLYGPLPDGSYGLGNPPPSPWAGYDHNYGEAVLDEKFAEITESIHAGKVGDNEDVYTAYLMEAAGSSMSPAASPFRPLVHVRYRAEAARLLGYIGSRETIPFLSGLFEKDPDPAVKTAAAEAIGRIGVDPDGTALRAFARAALQLKDEQTLTAAAAAIGALCRFSGPPLSETGIRLLNTLGSDGMPGRARTQARRELDGLRYAPGKV
ncbi:MAG: PQQ-binding-like beta-propeller repeat protein [Treponema sp.]|jgi:outer membrane protein assembly factor BamB|nr:PQQ-binding-like beta-propeller repeat protein [Treponema sp.]